MDISRTLNGISSESLDNGRRMCSVLAILYIFNGIKCNKAAFHDDIMNIFPMLSMKPKQVAPKKWTLEELIILKQFIPDELYSEMVACLVSLVNKAIKRKHLLQPQWLLVVPLIHILKEKIKTCDSLDENQLVEVSRWDDEDIELPPSHSMSAAFANKPR